MVSSTLVRLLLPFILAAIVSASAVSIEKRATNSEPGGSQDDRPDYDFFFSTPVHASVQYVSNSQAGQVKRMMEATLQRLGGSEVNLEDELPREPFRATFRADGTKPAVYFALRDMSEPDARSDKAKLKHFESALKIALGRFQAPDRFLRVWEKESEYEVNVKDNSRKDMVQLLITTIEPQGFSRQNGDSSDAFAAFNLAGCFDSGKILFCLCEACHIGAYVFAHIAPH
ncbi:MAG: hypothetical protein M1837_004032 [Sclerophora amabilis]|nr:MAG: hypothetical protein M1837_004032 [Sclerophora amabilis]